MIGANNFRISRAILVIELHFLFFIKHIVEKTSSTLVSNNKKKFVVARQTVSMVKRCVTWNPRINLSTTLTKKITEQICHSRSTILSLNLLLDTSLHIMVLFANLRWKVRTQ